MFGDLMDDVSGHEYLALRVRLAGDPTTHNSYFVNVQTGGPVSSDLWQHRLYFKKRDNDWEDIFVSTFSFFLIIPSALSLIAPLAHPCGLIPRFRSLILSEPTLARCRKTSSSCTGKRFEASESLSWAAIAAWREAMSWG